MARMINEMKNNFTVVHNEFLQDTDLGMTERGLLMTMLSKPDTYDFSIRGLAAQLPGGESSIKTALKNLERFGYLRREQIKEKGKFVDVLYRISDCPVFLDEPHVEKPIAENLHTEKPHAKNHPDNINTKETNTEKANTERKNTKSAHENRKLFRESVWLTNEQYQTLCDRHSREFVDQCIVELDLYKQSSGRTYKSDYHAILNWVVEKVSKKYPKLIKPTEQEHSPDYNPFDEFVGGQ